MKSWGYYGQKTKDCKARERVLRALETGARVWRANCDKRKSAWVSTMDGRAWRVRLAVLQQLVSQGLLDEVQTYSGGAGEEHPGDVLWVLVRKEEKKA